MGWERVRRLVLVDRFFGFELPGARRNDRALGLPFCVLTASFCSPAGCSRRLGGASQSGSEVHQRQILPARENQEEAGQLPGRLHLCPSQLC